MSMDSSQRPAPSLLLVDDDAIIAESLEYILSDEYDVKIARDPHQVDGFVGFHQREVNAINVRQLVAGCIDFPVIGIAVENDCDLEVASDNKQENVIISVSIGDVDAGFIRESALHSADQYIQPGTVKVVAPSAWLPNWALSVNRNLPAARKDAIRTAMIGLEKDAPVLKAMGVTGFRPATDDQYDIVRQVAGP